MDEDDLEALASHCVSARTITGEANDQFLCYLLDMVLLEVGRQIATLEEPECDLPPPAEDAQRLFAPQGFRRRFLL
jgi:hypothetical protein